MHWFLKTQWGPKLKGSQLRWYVNNFLFYLPLMLSNCWNSSTVPSGIHNLLSAKWLTSSTYSFTDPFIFLFYGNLVPSWQSHFLLSDSQFFFSNPGPGGVFFSFLTALSGHFCHVFSKTFQIRTSHHQVVSITTMVVWCHTALAVLAPGSLSLSPVLLQY